MEKYPEHYGPLQTYHGYFGIEATTVDFITNFINYN